MKFKVGDKVWMTSKREVGAVIGYSSAPDIGAERTSLGSEEIIALNPPRIASEILERAADDHARIEKRIARVIRNGAAPA